MITCKCIQKFRDKTGKIYGYRLQDLNNQIQDVTPDDLKRAIANKNVTVINLTLTSDNRLVDRKPEQQLQNKKIMPNNVEKPIEFNDKLEEIVEYCAIKISKAVSSSEATMIDIDKSVNGYVSAQFEVDGIIYKGTNRLLDIAMQFDKDARKLWIGLMDMDTAYTDADKCIQLKQDMRHNKDIINKFTDAYIKYIKQLENKKYRLLFKELMAIEEETDNILNRFPQCISHVKLVTLNNNDNYEDIIYNEGLDGELYPYMYTDGAVDTITDVQKHFIIAFIKDNYVLDTLFYSMDKNACRDTMEQHFRINETISKYCDYCEDAIGMFKDEYVGHTDDIQPIQKIETIAERIDTVLIKVTVTN